jgi:hypothetical protein
MANATETKFESLKERLRIDVHDLDNELVHLPTYIEEISEFVAKALTMRDAANNDLKLVMAEESERLRRIEEGGKKPTEKQIEADVLISRKVRDATLHLEDAKYQLSLWQGLMESARAKSDAIQVYAKLWIAGYVTSNSVTQSAREELAARRAERPELKRRGSE